MTISAIVQRNKTIMTELKVFLLFNGDITIAFANGESQCLIMLNSANARQLAETILSLLKKEE